MRVHGSLCVSLIQCISDWINAFSFFVIEVSYLKTMLLDIMNVFWALSAEYDWSVIHVQPNSLGPGVDPGHLVVTLAPGLDPAHIHPPSDGVAQNLGAPPLREFLHYSFIICFAKKPLSCSVMMNFSRAFCSSTAVLGTTSSKLPADTRLGEENKGHQLLMKMGTL